MQREPTKLEIATFRRTVLSFYKKSGRHDLPWRSTIDPYNIAVSEIMLQQTQVPRVIEKYQAFLSRFPTIEKLDRAPLTEVLALWSGLGYNRRAKFLKEMAHTVVLEYKGLFPRSERALVALPGIGAYTARAICAFAYNQPVVFIETNIRTVYIHHFFLDATKVSDSELLLIIEATLDQKNPRQWYAALMDYGTALKQAGNIMHRKSTHYVRQGTFHGSTRQLRGAIIKMLLVRPSTIAQLVRGTGRTSREVQTVLLALVREKMLTQQGKKYALANN